MDERSKQSAEAGKKLLKEREAEDLLLAIVVSFIFARWAIGQDITGREVERLSQAEGVLDLLKAWGEVIFGIVVISILSIYIGFFVPQLKNDILSVLSDFKVKRLDWWLEKPCGRMGFALTIVIWSLIVAFMTWLKWG